MSTNDILKALQCAPQLSTSTFTRWSDLVERVFSDLDIEAHIYEHISDLHDAKVESTKTSPLHRQDRQIQVALISLVPEELFHLVSNLNTAKEMWDSIQTFFKPRCEGIVVALLKDFWRFEMPDGTSVDKFAEELVRRQMRIASVDPSLQPRDDITKGYLDFFDTCCGGYFAGSVTTLRNNTDCSFAGAVQSLRLTQANYVGHKPLPSVSLVSSNRGPGAPPADNSLNISVNPHKGKTCGHCG